MSKLVDGFIKVKLDYAPTTNGKKAREWFEGHGFAFFGVGRRAWCSQYSTYFRDALGVAYTEGGETFLFYDDDVAQATEAMHSVQSSAESTASKKARQL